MTIEQFDLTGHPSAGRCLEVLTDAGIIRVNVGLEDTRTRGRVVVVEIEPNLGDLGMRKTQAGGHWVTEVQDRVTWTDVTLTKDG